MVTIERRPGHPHPGPESAASGRPPTGASPGDPASPPAGGAGVAAGRSRDPFRVPASERFEPFLASIERWRDRPLASAGAGVVVVAVVAMGWWLGRPSSAGPIESAIPFTAAAEPAGLSPAPSPGGGGGPPSVTPDPPSQAGGSTDGSGDSGDPPELLVHVAGAVVRPGVVTLIPGDRVIDAVLKAGGPTPAADLHQLNLAAPVLDGLQITVPAQGEIAPSPTGVAPGQGWGAAPGVPSGPLDVNLASEAELDELPGIGPSLAAAITAWREERGPFTSVDALLDVPGIGPAKLAALLDHVTV